MFASTPYSFIVERPGILLARLLDDIHEDGYNPCLVFERGDETLEEWMKQRQPAPFQRKEAMLQVRTLTSHSF